MDRPSFRRLPTAAVLSLLVLTAACGEEAGDVSGGTEGGSFPVTVTAANGAVRIPERPGQIVSLSPTATEMLFAIGAGEQVEAVDSASNYPTDAPTTDLSGFQPNAEAVAQREPDLVVVSDDTNEIVESLTALDIPVLQMPAATDLADSYEQIEQLGAATGRVGEAAAVVADMTSEIERLTGSATDRNITYYHELDQKLFSVTSNTFIGQVYKLLGLDNIADAAEGADTGYPQLSAEYVIQADPDAIFLADTKCCGQTAEKVAARPGWDRVTAVRNDAVVELDDDIASRWGPRVVDLIEIVAEKIGALEPAGS